MTTLLSAGEVAAWPCMTPEEYELWRLGGTKVPCVDCPLWFADQARAAGCCKGKPGEWERRPRKSPDIRLRGRGNPYPSEADRLAARRASWRESKRRAKARCNDSSGGAQ